MMLSLADERFVWRRLSDGGAFVVDTANGESLVLNTTAADFLTEIGAGASFPDVCARFCDVYGLAADEIAADLAELLSRLVELGLVTEKEGV